MNTRPEAENAYEIWKRGLTADMREAFHPLIRAVDNWHPHIFAYFDHRVTNAYTESLNNLIRVTNRLAEATASRRFGPRSCSPKARTRSSAPNSANGGRTW